MEWSGGGIQALNLGISSPLRQGADSTLGHPNQMTTLSLDRLTTLSLVCTAG
jgi:hypothetical protein